MVKNIAINTQTPIKETDCKIFEVEGIQAKKNQKTKNSEEDFEIRVWKKNFTENSEELRKGTWKRDLEFRKRSHDKNPKTKF